jgi:hypothetical protein
MLPLSGLSLWRIGVCGVLCGYNEGTVIDGSAALWVRRFGPVWTISKGSSEE